MKKVCVIVLTVCIGIPLDSWSQVLHDEAPTARSLPTDVGGLLALVEEQAMPSGWEQLQKRPVGTRVRIRLSSGAELEGDLVEVRDDAVLLANNALRRGQFRTLPGASLSDRHTFARTDVSNVTIVEPTSLSATQKKFLWLAAFGSVFVLGFLIRARSR